MIWEAQSRYVLGYFVLMLPLAAAGLAVILDGIKKRKEKREEKLAWDCQMMEDKHETT